LCLTAEYSSTVCGFSALGRKGKAAETVAEEACRDLLAHHAAEAPVDPHLADQLLLPLALARGRSELRTSCVTRHLVTNAQIIGQIIPVRIGILGEQGQPGQVVVEGLGFTGDDWGKSSG
jgi:RNA 3'-terminal phosphate cyclase (ATP)